MTKPKSLLAGFWLAILSACPALAQGAGQLDAGQLWANCTATADVAQPCSATSWLDQAIGSTAGMTLARGASVWAAVPARTTITASVTASNNDYSPAGYTTATGWLRLTSTGSWNITGIVAQTAGDILLVTNVGTSNKITLVKDSASSAAANRMTLGNDVTLGPAQTQCLVYDSSSVWRPCSAASGFGGPLYINSAKVLNFDGTYAILASDASNHVVCGNSGDPTCLIQNTTTKIITLAAATIAQFDSTGLTMPSGKHIFADQIYNPSSNILLTAGAALATNATVGFPLISTTAGTPSGAPTFAAAGSEAIVIDTTANAFWWHSNSAWHRAYDYKTPTVQVFTSGSGTYTTPSGAVRLEIKLVGGGGGGAGGGTGPGNGGNGGATCWNTSGSACTSPVFSAGGGTGATGGAGAGGAGGSTSGSGTIQISETGGTGGTSRTAVSDALGGLGGQSCRPNSGMPGYGATGADAAPANRGGGGHGGGATNTVASGAGGGAGACAFAILSTPAATYTYAVGAAGTNGTAGSFGSAGGAGGSGWIVVTEYYN